jgi:hypothetical protein
MAARSVPQHYSVDGSAVLEEACNDLAAGIPRSLADANQQRSWTNHVLYFRLRADATGTQCQGQIAVRDDADRPLILDDDQRADIIKMSWSFMFVFLKRFSFHRSLDGLECLFP